MKGNPIALIILLAAQVLLGTGCTTALWEKDRFTQYHHPADTADLKFFYSDKRQDILVKYDEVHDGSKTVEHRAYWLDQNRWRIDHAWKPRFVSGNQARDLMPIPVAATRAPRRTTGGADLYAVVSTNGWFTLYSGDEELLSRELPAYYDGFKRMAARLALTPAAVTVDAATVAGVTSPFWGPYVAAALLRRSGPAGSYPQDPPKQ